MKVYPFLVCEERENPQTFVNLATYMKKMAYAAAAIVSEVGDLFNGFVTFLGYSTTITFTSCRSFVRKPVILQVPHTLGAKDFFHPETETDRQ